MIVEHTESFQAWLTKILKPLCDADPGALAKYVLALIKKDKTEKELRQSMTDQLDVFLQSETKPFVDKLFEALNTKEYLNAKSESSGSGGGGGGSAPSKGDGGKEKRGGEDSKAESKSNFISSLTPVSGEGDAISSSSGPTASVNAANATAEGAASSSSASHGSKKGSNTLSVTPSVLLSSETSPANNNNNAPADIVKEESNSANKNQGGSSSRGPRGDRRGGEDERDKNRRKRSRTDRDSRRNSRSRSADRGPMSKRSRSPRMERERERERDRNDRPLRHRLGGGRKSPPPRRYERDVWDRRRSRSPLMSGRNRSCSPRNSNRSRSPPPPRYRRPFNSSRSRSRSPPRGGPMGERQHSPRTPRSRSRSPHNKDGAKDPKKDSLLPIPPGMDADLTIKELADKAPLVQSVVVRPGITATDSSQSAPQGVPPPPGNNRCRDFDEKGLCMRGELCPYDHGKDPVVLEDIVVPTVGAGGPGGYGAGGRGMVPGAPGYTPPGMVRPGMGIGEYYPDSPSLEPPGVWGPGAPPFRPRHPLGFDPVAARGGRGGMLLRPGMGPYPVPGGQRQLISVPVVGGGQLPPGAPGVMGGPPPGMPPMMPHPGMRGMHMRGGHRGGRGGFDHGRLGAKPPHHHGHHHQNQHRNYSNCSLEVRKIPREQNTIMDLNSHFLRFGKIINIQINYDSDPEAALVTFRSPAEAQLAYRSTEAVLNNRFIRVFWHNKEKENDEEMEGGAGQPGVPGAPLQRIPVKERLGGQAQEQPMEHEKILLSGNNLTKTVYNNAALLKAKETTQDKLQTVESIKRSQEMLAAQVTLKNLQEQKKAEALKMSNDLRKRQQTIMEEQIGQQKKLIERLESGSLSAKEKEETLKILKVLQESVGKLRRDLEESNPNKLQQHQLNQHQLQKKGASPGTPGGTPPTPGANVRAKEEAQKEMLDAELDLINKEQQGEDTIDLQKKVLELRARAKSLGLIGSPMGMPRGRGGFRGVPRGFGRGRGGMLRGRGRGAVRALRSVDRRPTKLRVTGFPATKLSDILSHFSTFGNIRDYSSDALVPMMIVDFDTRKCAEVAMANGSSFEDSKLSLEWVVDPPSEGPSKLPGASDGAMSNNGESSNHHHHDDLDNSEVIDEDDMDNFDELGAILGTSEMLTGEDEEEDEDDRSWRR